jgi:hypothetical protein
MHARWWSSVVAVAIGSLMFAAAASANTINVETLADPGDGSQCTLRDAITAANTHAVNGDCPAGATGSDDITVTPSGTIQLASALPHIATSLTITGATGGTTVRGEGSSDPYKIFEVEVFDTESTFPFTRPVVTISNLTITDGVGGVQNGGILTLNNVNVTGNSIANTGVDAQAFGAGINQCPCGDFTSLTVNNSSVTGNSVSATSDTGSTFSAAQGAAIEGGGFPVSISQSTISGNTATASGGTNFAVARGAISVVDADATITRSTINGNTTSASNGDGGSTFVPGGGIDWESSIPPALDLILDGDTITGNTATGGLGGGVYAEGFGSKNVLVKGSTIASNSAGNGANVYFNAGESALTFQNTIIANPIGSTNCERANGDFTSLGHNLDTGALGVPTDSNVCFEGTAAQGDQNGVSPQLGSLQDNGGQTMTMAPGINSPAVDKGIAAGDTVDQRGLPRTFDMGHSISAGGDGTDIGAFEQTIIAAAPDPDPDTIPFGPQRWGTASGNQAVSVLNRTGIPITPGTLAFTGINPSDFQLNSNTCSNTPIANGFSCSVNAVLHPVSAGGALSASLDIPIDVAPTQSISVSGTSTEFISLVPSPKDYGSTQVATPTAATQFTVENAGPGTSGTLAATLTGANASEFGITQDNCTGQTLADDGTCTVLVRFAPTSAGAKAASLNITGTPGGTQSSALTGTATAPPPPPTTTTPTTTPPPAGKKKCKKAKKGASAAKKCKKKKK